LIYSQQVPHSKAIKERERERERERKGGREGGRRCP